MRFISAPSSHNLVWAKKANSTAKFDAANRNPMNRLRLGNFIKAEVFATFMG